MTAITPIYPPAPKTPKEPHASACSDSHPRNGFAAATVFVFFVGILSFTLPVSGQTPARDSTGGEVMNGWRIFNDKRCVECHSIWDQGGQVGPDLGRIRTGQLSRGQLAGVMWNHIPKMLSRMEQAGQPPVSLSESEMADLFALIYFVRQLDELGDPVQGERVLQQKGCAECHSINDPNSGHAPDLAKWGSYANPVIWAQMMWEHAPVMELAMKRSGMRWPKLESDDLVHIVAYVRSAGISKEKTYLLPGNPQAGRRLFVDKQCDSCHPGSGPGPGPDLARADLPISIGALASRMWNHSPEMTRLMREEDVARLQISPQELTHILAYVLALGDLDRGGDNVRGGRVFMRKGCAQCHGAEEMLQGVAPSFQQLHTYATPVKMATAMWNHGQTMLEKMTEAGMSWPVFADNEMADLLAYLKSIESSGNEAQSTTKEKKQ